MDLNLANPAPAQAPTAFDSFATTNPPNDFLNSNNMISRFAFLLLVVFLFVLLLRLGTMLLSKVFSGDNQHLVDGTMSAKNNQVIIPQDPNSSGAKTIYRSVNADEGIEFTWSVWLNITSLQGGEGDTGKFKHVFSKGNADFTNSGIIQPNNAPGLYIAPHTNAIVIIMNSFNVINEEITISNIPIGKWFNVMIRCQNTRLDIYINGTVARSISLTTVPKQNLGDVYIAANGGFDGYLSNLWYYNHALETNEIHRLVSRGPNTKIIGSNGLDDTTTDYLSLRWFFTPAASVA